MNFGIVVPFAILLFGLNYTTATEQSWTKENQVYDRQESELKKSPPKKCQTCDGPRSKNAEDSISSWFENLPIPPVVVAKSNSIPNEECKRQLQLYLRDLRNGSMWATQMYDASAKYPYGVIDGHTRHFGNFDQCYRLDAKIPSEEDAPTHIRGRYCLVDYKYEQRDGPSEFHGEHVFDFEPHESAWEAIRERGDYRRVKRYLLQMALCVPAVCSNTDIERSLQSVFRDFGATQNLNVKVSVDIRNCQAYYEEPEFSTSAIIFCAVVVGLFMLVTAGTICDKPLDSETEKTPQSKGMELLLCFSARRNLKSIFTKTYDHPGLDSIHMLRFLGLIVILGGHRSMQFWMLPTVNERYLEISTTSLLSTILYNGTLIVDAFYGFGGLVLAYGLLSHFEKSKHMNFINLTLMRFIRLTPAYLLIVAFYAIIFPYLGSGPEWKFIIGSKSQRCVDNWWTNMLYINNYVNSENYCMFQSWSLSVDFHCYLISVFLLYGFSKWPRKYGYSLLGLVIIISAAIPFYITYTQNLVPYFFGYPYLRNVRDDPYYVKYYIKSHVRLLAYLVGVLFGALIYDYKSATWRLPKVWSHVVFYANVIFLFHGSLFIGYPFYNPNNTISPLLAALYATIHRGTFAAGVCLTILLFTIGDGLEEYYRLFTPGFVQPIARLNYGIFLTHNIIQAYQMGVARTAKSFAVHNMFYEVVPDYIFSILLALLLSICIEGPFRRMEKIFISKSAKNASSNTSSSLSKEAEKKTD